MTALKWDETGKRRYETGVSKGVLYVPTNGTYPLGVAWNGLVTVTESPSGAEASPQYADNQIYLNLTSAERFGATLEAFTYPDEFEECDGTASLIPGVTVGQQRRKPFGLSYQTLIGDDVLATDLGYKIHFVYGAMAAPTEKARATVNESPEALTMSWELTTTPVPVAGKRPSAHLTVDSTQVDPAKLADLEAIIYGTAGQAPRMPFPEEIAAILDVTLILSTPTMPVYVLGTKTLTIPTVVGTIYKIDGVVKNAGNIVLAKDTIVTVVPAAGYKFPPVTDVDWLFKIT